MGRGGKVSALLGVLGALIVAAAAGEGSAAAAAIPRGLEVTPKDDALLLYRPRGQVRRTARRIAAIGADRVRLTASWSALAPDPDSRQRPRFDATNPSRYRREGIRRLDIAVSEATAAGLSVQIDLAFWAPRWAVARTLSGDRQRWRPSSGEYGRFALALARRYSGGLQHRRRRLPGALAAPRRAFANVDLVGEPVGRLVRRLAITTFSRSSASPTGAEASDRPRPSQKPGGPAPRSDDAGTAHEYRERDRDRPPLAPVIPLWAYKERHPNTRARKKGLRG